MTLTLTQKQLFFSLSWCDNTDSRSYQLSNGKLEEKNRDRRPSHVRRNVSPWKVQRCACAARFPLRYSIRICTLEWSYICVKMCVFFAHMFAEQNKIQSGNARLTSSNAPPGTSASRTSTGAMAIRIVQIRVTRTALRPLTTLHTPLRLPVRSFFNVSIASFIIHSCNLVWRVPLSLLRPVQFRWLCKRSKSSLSSFASIR